MELINITPSSQYSQASMDDNHILHLQCESSAEGGLCNIYIVGSTDHNDRDSNSRVRQMIRLECAKTVFLDMCDEGFAIMLADDYKQTLKDLFHMWLQGKRNLLHVLGYWLLMKSRSPRKRLVKSEFEITYETAKQYGAKVVFGGRPIKITMDRIWASFTILEKVFLTIILSLRILFCRPSKKEEEGKAVDEEQIEFLLEERQMYMAYNLSKEAKQCSSIVAVVGKTNLIGIMKYWPLASTIDMEKLSEVPTVRGRTSAVKILASVGVVTAILIGTFIWRKH